MSIDGDINQYHLDIVILSFIFYLNDFSQRQFISKTVKKAYIQAPTSEKHCIYYGEEFSIHTRKVALIKRAFCGDKSTGRDYWLHLKSYMEILGFKSCKVDPDVWMREAVKDDGTEYYEYAMLYVDNTITIQVNLKKILRNEIGKYFKLKESSIGSTGQYLGGKIQKVFWRMESNTGHLVHFSMFRRLLRMLSIPL